MCATVVGIVSALAGVVLGAGLSAFFHHREWVGEQKKLEYRELLDQLYDTVSAVTEARPGLPPPEDSKRLNTAIQKLALTFEDRIFIAHEIGDSGAQKLWLNMKKMIYDYLIPEVGTAPDSRYSPTRLHEREDALRKLILELADKDMVRFRLL
ncbi:MAG TPA: hypothetical protein VGT08_05905 [Terracidiphilus sp.]|nr:hypothetical protein [Terracidiphilus sp.]